MAARLEALRDLWELDQPTIGGWCAIPSAISAELLGVAGFDWVVIDAQHGLVGFEDLAVMLPALSNAGVPALVRVPWNEPSAIMKALDAGAQGVIVPMVNSPEDARLATEACRFPPRGNRSWGPVRPSLYDQEYAPATANRNVICAVMVETVDAVASVDDILAVPGIDAVFVGPSDLAISAGFLPSADPTEPVHLELIETVLKACKARGIVAGIACGNAGLVRRWRDEGFRMLAVPSDMSLLSDAAAQLLRDIG
ncbi:HpcH/HpaI aldolase family protein [Tenggerimyces flavus]|uniref:HpcH/HpaI aldolase/citrate lyase family protein n=1 Tax=Tenggerimyces flavus TaxID=1708749 RepID=A0ABV7YK96_9ACTN|nr:aldolase/citrate lyase family protein [Tenggerimyces flavus]MBM7789611.1 4-hydroxy-2-oxoheptanedioate aldolase [Tenggerimyces flavus]